jgi:hypothetical protein
MRLEGLDESKIGKTADDIHRLYCSNQGANVLKENLTMPRGQQHNNNNRVRQEATP